MLSEVRVLSASRVADVPSFGMSAPLTIHRNACMPTKDVDT